MFSTGSTLVGIQTMSRKLIPRLFKKRQKQTPQATAIHIRNEAPVVTPRTEARYTFPNLVELVTFMITWGIERGGACSDKELGEMLDTFVDPIVVLSPSFN